MTDRELDELARAVRELKKVTSRNDPFLRSLFSTGGWLGLGIAGGLGITLFCLPAHILSALYGSFGAAPPVFRAVLWAILALVMVAGGVAKARLLMRKASEADSSAGMGKIVSAIFGGWGFHLAVPLVLSIAGVSTFVVLAGHPWLSVPASAILVCFWANIIGLMVEHREYLAMGWWCLATGVAGLFFVEAAPFLWLFIIYGGLFWIFTAWMAFMDGKEKREAQRNAQGS